jgi:hypothetical protein
MLALGTKVYNSDKLIHGGLSGTTQHDLVEKADGFAEVFPTTTPTRCSRRTWCTPTARRTRTTSR